MRLKRRTTIIDTSQELGQITIPILARLLGAAVTLIIGRGLANLIRRWMGWLFVPISDFLSFQSDIAWRVKQGFDESGVVIPRPQQEVHLVKVQESDRVSKRRQIIAKKLPNRPLKLTAQYRRR
jgi:small-conductance mechanosensitive channel